MALIPRRWLITGASTGLGRAVAETALAAGDTVIGTSRDVSRLQPLVAHDGPGAFHAFELDVMAVVHPPGASTAIMQIVEAHGEFDVLVNAAGHLRTGSLADTTDEDLWVIFDINFYAPAALIRAALPVIRSRPGGAVLQVTWGEDRPIEGFGAVSSSRAAIERFVDVMSHEVADVHFLVVDAGAGATLVAPVADGVGIAEASRHDAARRIYEAVIDPRSPLRPEVTAGN